MTWTNQSINIPRTLYSAGYAVLNNRLYVGGGIQNGLEGSRQYAWSPGDVAWATLASLPASACTTATFHVRPGYGIGNGLVHYFGGGDDCFLLNPDRATMSYNPVSNCFAGACGLVPAQPCISRAAYGYACASLNDITYLLGGMSGAAAYESHHSFFNAVTRTTGTRALPPGPVRAFGAAVALDGQIYYLGGAIANLAGDVFTDACAAPAAPGIDLFCCLLGDPCCVCDPDVATTNRVDAYNPATNTWSSKAAMPAAIAGHVAVVWNDKIYVFDGVDSCNNFNASVHVYSPVCNMWLTVPLVSATYRVHSAGGVLDIGGGDRRVYRAGGQEPGSVYSNRLERLGYTVATAPNVPTCTITSPAPSEPGCDCVDVDYTVTDADTVSLSAVWKYSTDNGLTWSLATSKTAAPNPTTIAPGSGTFQWDAGTDVGSGPIPVIFAMCVTDGREFGEDRVAFIVDCASVPCCILPGDCDSNGRIDVLDAHKALLHDAGIVIMTGVPLANCNVAIQSQGTVTVLDGLRIAHYAVGLVPALDCCQ